MKPDRSFYKSSDAIARFKVAWNPGLLSSYELELLGLTKPIKSRLASKDMG